MNMIPKLMMNYTIKDPEEQDEWPENPCDLACF